MGGISVLMWWGGCILIALKRHYAIIDVYVYMDMAFSSLESPPSPIILWFQWWIILLNLGGIVNVLRYCVCMHSKMFECNPIWTLFPQLGGCLLRSLGWDVSLHGSHVNVFAGLCFLDPRKKFGVIPCVDEAWKRYCLWCITFVMKNSSHYLYCCEAWYHVSSIGLWRCKLTHC